MLFNSYEFIFCFLPAFLILFYAALRYCNFKTALTAIVGASFFFYGFWNPPYLLLLILSIVMNYAGYRLILRFNDQGNGRKAKLTAGIVIALDLLSIGYFKYFNFLAGNLAALLNIPFAPYSIFLPLGISFFTFQSIAFVLDALKPEKNQLKSCSLLEFAAFISFFPQLIAGPIVHAHELIPQLREKERLSFSRENMAEGFTIFFIGLAKKILIADALSPYANEIFNAAQAGTAITFFEALYGMLAYSLQLYFDFSGYSDMAYGLALLIGVKLPINFNSPYKAHSLVDFWSRWHITLSRFLKDYVYIPFGGNRFGTFRRFRNLLATMLIGGIWHGAGWTFIIWGGMHGVGLIINHAWKILCDKYRQLAKFRNSALWTVAASVLTLIFVFLAWIVFRAENFTGVKMMFRGICGLNGAVLPEAIVNIMPGFLRNLVSSTGIMPLLGNGSIMKFVSESVLIFGSLLLAIFGKNVYEMPKKMKYIIIIAAFYFVLQRLLFAVEQTEFLYFQF